MSEPPTLAPDPGLPSQTALGNVLSKFFEGVRSLNRDEFQLERLRSYYLARTDLAVHAHWALAEARALEGGSPSAACVMAATASEIVVKAAILRPLVHGLVHHEELAEYVAEAALGHTALERFDKLLVQLIREFAEMELKPMAGPSSTLWKGMQADRVIRNGVVHRGTPATPTQAGAAIRTASQLLDGVLPAVLKRLGLDLDANGYVVQSLSALEFVMQARGLAEPEA